MDKFGVPCPQCGSVRVVVGSRTGPPVDPSTVTEHGNRHIPQLHRCACEDCRHTFDHDFAFGG